MALAALSVLIYIFIELQKFRDAKLYLKPQFK